jgi:mandelate racemase
MSLPALTVHSVEAHAVIAPLKRAVRTAVGSIEAAPLVLIDVNTHEGVTGSAYIFAYLPTALAALRRAVADIGAELAGKAIAPFDLMQFFDRRFRLIGWQGLVGMAISGLDMAFWDALGRAAGEPVARLLGGAPKPLAAYDSYGVIDLRKDLDVLANSVSQGFRAIKIKGGDGDLANDIATVKAVREAIGPTVALMIDFNQSLTAPEAIRRIRALEEFDLTWIEEPVKAEDLAGHAQVRSAVGIPIQTGENWWFPAGMAAAIEAQACDFAMPDAMKIGGVTGWMKAAALGEAAGIPISSHLFAEASSHLLAVTPTAHFLEWLDFASPLLTEPFLPKDGCATARGPGLGMSWDKDAVRRFKAE